MISLTGMINIFKEKIIIKSLVLYNMLSLGN